MKSKCVSWTGDLQFKTYILPVLPLVVGQPITPRRNAFEEMMRRQEQQECPKVHSQWHAHTSCRPAGGGFSWQPGETIEGGYGEKGYWAQI